MWQTKGETTKISQRWTKFLFPFQKIPSMSHVASDYLRLNYRVTKWPFCMWSPRGWPRATACETRWNSCAITRASWPSFPTLQICYFLFPCSLIHLVPYLFLALYFPYIMSGRVSIAFVFTFTPFCVENFLGIFSSSCNILQCHMPLLNPYPKNMHNNPIKTIPIISEKNTKHRQIYSTQQTNTRRTPTPKHGTSNKTKYEQRRQGVSKQRKSLFLRSFQAGSAAESEKKLSSRKSPQGK